MSNENHNNSYWKNKLEDENALSAEILPNKNIAWEKLHNRLQEKPGRKKFLWYWIAAASLLPAIVISLTFLLKNENSVVKNNVSKSSFPNPELKQIQRLESTAVTAVSVTDITKQKTQKIKTKSINNITIVSAGKEHSDTTIQITDNKIISPFPVADSSNTTNIAKAQPKKKLKVVHINELGEPAEELPETAHHSNLHYFQLKLANQEVYRSTSLTSNNTGINLFKTKISPSN